MLGQGASTQPGVVVVTGASTGIGRSSALMLAALGHVVYAGVRREEHGQELVEEAGASAKLHPMILDVTNHDHVADAARRVRAELNGLPFAGVVNNAGIAVAAPLEFLPVEDLRDQFEVNVIGQVAMSQAFLPILREYRGRLVYVGSVSGLVASRLLGAYAASKFALEAVADAFRRELKPHGVGVSLVEPGRIATPIWDKSMEEGLARLQAMGPEAREYYGQVVQDLVDSAKDASVKSTSPEAVAKAVVRALSDRRMRTRYFVGTDAHIVNVLRRVMPDPMLDRIINATNR